MATETELETLLVRLVGDASSYTTMLKDAALSAQKTADSVAVSTAKIEGFKGSLEGYGKGIAAVASTAAKAFAALGVSVGLFAAYEKFEKSEVNAMRLGKAIEMQGGNVAETTKQFKAFAQQMGETTAVSRGATLALLQEATAMGLSATQAERAVKNAIALGAQKNTDPSQFIRGTTMLEKGYVSRSLGMELGLAMKGNKEVTDDAKESFEEYGDSLGEMTKDTVKAAEAQDRLNKLFDIAKVEGNTTAREIERIKEEMAKFQKEVGALVANALLPMIQKLNELAKWINDLSPSTRKWIATTIILTGTLLLLSTALTALSGGFTVALAALKAFSMASQYGVVPTVAYYTAITATAYAGYQFGKSLSDTAPVVLEFNAAMEKAIDNQSRWLKLMKGEGQRIKAEFAGLADAEKEAFATEQIGIAEKAVGRYEKMIEQTKDSIAKGTGVFFDDASVKVDQQRIAEYTDGIKIMRDRIADWKKELEGIKEQPLMQSKDLAKDVKALNDRLQDQIGILAQGAEEYEIWKLKTRGATAEQLKGLTVAAAVIKTMEEQKKKFEDLQAAQQKMADDGKALTQEVMSPAEKLAARVQEIDKLMKGGVISEQTYLRAISAAQKTFEDTAESVKELKEELQAVNAVAFGSAAAIERINQYREGLKKPTATTNDATADAQRIIAASRANQREAQFGPVLPPQFGGDKPATDLANGLLRQILAELKNGNKKPDVEIKPANWFS